MFKVIGIILAVAAALGGCGLSPNCEPSDALNNTREVPGIVVPDGLDPLDPNRALDVPIATSPPRENPDECIDKPPDLRNSG